MSRIPFWDWVATGPILIGNALAFTAGQLIPNSTVAAFGLDVTGQAVPATDPPAAPDTPTTMYISVGEVA